MDTSANEYLKGVIEAILFISEKPVTVEQFNEVMAETVGAADVRKLIEELKDEYENKQRGMVIVEIAGGYQMLSSQHYATYVRSFLKTKVKEKLSRPALETLAIVAYKQPVSRGDIEVIRGVNSDGVVLHLLNKSLIKIVGKKDVPGRPFLYGTSKLFLEYFGLKSLRDLPKLEDVSLLLSQSAENAEQAGIEEPLQQESLAAQSRALDEAEAKAAGENLEKMQPSAEPATALEEHVELARQNVEDIIPAAPHDAGERADTLKEALQDMNREEDQRSKAESRLPALEGDTANPGAQEDI